MQTTLRGLLDSIRLDAVDALFGMVYLPDRTDSATVRAIQEFASLVPADAADDVQAEGTRPEAAFRPSATRHHAPLTSWRDEDIESETWVLNNLLSLWLWKYDKNSDKMRHWSLVLPNAPLLDEYVREEQTKNGDYSSYFAQEQQPRDDLASETWRRQRSIYEKNPENYKLVARILDALERTAIKGGRSSVGVLAWSNKAVILDDTSLDPRASAGVEDMLIRDLSWVGIPVSDGENVQLVVSFYLPYEFAWRDRTQVVDRLSAIVDRRREVLLRYAHELTLKDEADTVAQVVGQLSADEVSIPRALLGSKLVDATAVLLLTRDKDGWVVEKPEHIVLDIDEADNSILREMEWCTFLRKHRFWTDCQGHMADPVWHIPLPLSLPGVTCVPTTGEPLPSPSGRSLGLRFHFVEGDATRQAAFAASVMSLLDRLLQPTYAQSGQVTSKEDVPERETKKEIALSDRKRLGDLRKVLFNCLMDALYDSDAFRDRSGRITRREHENRLQTCQTVVDRFTSVGSDAAKLDVSGLGRELAEITKTECSGMQFGDIVESELLGVEFWESGLSDYRKRVIIRKVDGDQRGVERDVSCFAWLTSPRVVERKVVEDEELLKHPGTLTVLWRMSDELRESRDCEAGRRSALEVLDRYAPLYSLLRNVTFTVDRGRESDEALGGVPAWVIAMRSRRSDVEVRLLDDPGLGEVLWTPRDVRLCAGPFTECLWRARFRNRIALREVERSRIVEKDGQACFTMPWQRGLEEDCELAALDDRHMLAFHGVRLPAALRPSFESYIEQIRETYRVRVAEYDASLRSAVAGIMARNMSHNIGSHVLAAKDLLEGKHPDEVTKLHSFLQQRMDYIAQVVTYTPNWGEPMLFHGDLMRGFLKQYLLIDYLTRDTGLPGEKVGFYLHMDGNELVFSKPRDHRREDGREGGEWVLPQGANPPPDFFVSVPGGSIGMHAFYDILENVMRNSAKYGERPKAEKDVYMEVHLAVTKESDRYSLRLWSSLDKQDKHENNVKKCDCRVCKLQRALTDELIDPTTHQTTAVSRGIYEMKKCAEVLSGHIGGASQTRTPSLLAESHEHDRKRFLSYVFSIEKPRLVGLVGLPVDGMAATESGVFAYESVDALSAKPCQMAVVRLDDEGTARQQVLASIGKNRHLLPFRLMVVTDTAATEEELKSAKVPARRVCSVARSEFGTLPDCADTTTEWSRFVVGLYELWLRSRFPTSAGSRWQMVVNFDRDKGHAAFARWKDGLTSYFGACRHSQVPLHVHLVRARLDSALLEAVEYSSDKKDSRESLAMSLTQQASRSVWFDNHRAALNALGLSKLEQRFRAFNDVGERTSPKLFALLDSPPAPGPAFDLLLLNLLESALTSVVIVDERVADAVLDEDQGITRGVLEALFKSGCFPVFSVRTKETALPVFVSDAIESRGRRLADRKNKGRLAEGEGIYLGDVTVLKAQSPFGSETRDLCAADLVVVHQGVIDRLADRLGLAKDEEWPGLKHIDSFAPSVVITSGRGKTLRHIPQTIPFLEFSIIRDNTYAEVSKYHLVRALLSTTGE